MDKKVANGFGGSRDQDGAGVASIRHPNKWFLGASSHACSTEGWMAMLALATLFFQPYLSLSPPGCTIF